MKRVVNISENVKKKKGKWLNCYIYFVCVPKSLFSKVFFFFFLEFHTTLFHCWICTHSSKKIFSGKRIFSIRIHANAEEIRIEKSIRDDSEFICVERNTKKKTKKHDGLRWSLLLLLYVSRQRLFYRCKQPRQNDADVTAVAVKRPRKRDHLPNLHHRRLVIIIKIITARSRGNAFFFFFREKRFTACRPRASF